MSLGRTVGDTLWHRIQFRPNDFRAEIPAIGPEGKGEAPGNADQILRLEITATGDRTGAARLVGMRRDLHGADRLRLGSAADVAIASQGRRLGRRTSARLGAP